MTRNRSLLAAALLLALLSTAPAHATSCWTTPHTFSAEVVSVGQLNEMTANDACNHTEINSDGTITRDVMLQGTTSVAGNSGSSATTVNSYSMPAGTVSVNGSTLMVEAGFVCAANGNTKTIEWMLGSTAITASSSACNGSVIIVRLTMIRASATSEKVYGTATSSGLGGNLFASDAFAENLANALTVKFRLTGTSTNDLQQSWVTVRQSRHP